VLCHGLGLPVMLPIPQNEQEDRLVRGAAQISYNAAVNMGTVV